MDKNDIIRKYGRPVYFGDYRAKYSFTRSSNGDLERYINEDNYGAFRINTALSGITWHRICDPHSIYYLYSKTAGKILRALLKIGKEDRTVSPCGRFSTTPSRIRTPHSKRSSAASRSAPRSIAMPSFRC